MNEQLKSINISDGKGGVQKLYNNDQYYLYRFNNLSFNESNNKVESYKLYQDTANTIIKPIMVIDNVAICKCVTNLFFIDFKTSNKTGYVYLDFKSIINSPFNYNNPNTIANNVFINTVTINVNDNLINNNEAISHAPVGNVIHNVNLIDELNAVNCYYNEVSHAWSTFILKLDWYCSTTDKDILSKTPPRLYCHNLPLIFYYLLSHTNMSGKEVIKYV